MDAQVFVVGELRQYRIGYGADAHLQTGAVFDDAGNVFANADFFGSQFGRSSCKNGLTDPHGFVYFADVNIAITLSSGHLVIDLGNHIFGCFYRRQGSLYTYTQRTVTVLIRG